MQRASRGTDRSGLSRGLVRFGLYRALVLFLVLLVVPYLIITVMNWDGVLDEMRESQIRYEVAMRIGLTIKPQELPPAERERLIEEAVQEEYRRQGLDRPFVIRNFRHMWWAITLDLGRSQDMISDTFSRQARTILVERVWPTFRLFGIAMLLVFLISFFFAMLSCRRPGRFLDRLFIRLAPISAVPVWFYALLLPPVFAAHTGALPWGRAVGAILLGSVFGGIYNWRTFFVGHSSDEQLDPAGAGESSAETIDRGSFMRPTPTRITSHFLVLATSVLMGAIVLEAVLNWPGLGRLLYQAILLNDTAVILGALVIYGYVLALLVVVVFLLDFLEVRLILRRMRAGEE